MHSTIYIKNRKTSIPPTMRNKEEDIYSTLC